MIHDAMGLLCPILEVENHLLKLHIKETTTGILYNLE